MNVSGINTFLLNILAAPSQPDKNQLVSISDWTNSKDVSARRAIQFAFQRRIENPKDFSLLEIVNTLSIIHGCLKSAAPEFGQFFSEKTEVLNQLLVHPFKESSPDHLLILCELVKKLVQQLRAVSWEKGKTNSSRTTMMTPPTTPNKSASLLPTINSGIPRLLPPSPQHTPPRATVSLTSTEMDTSSIETIRTCLVPNITQLMELDNKSCGSGSFSTVYKGSYQHPAGRQEVAVKFLRRLTDVPKERLAKRLRREIKAFWGLNHRNIGDFYGLFIRADDPTEIGMVSRWYPNGNLLVYLKGHPKTDPLLMMKSIADGILYIHNEKLIHGDIKSPNIMIDINAVPKLIDFGLAKVIDGSAKHSGDTTMTLNSSIRWAAPELIKEKDLKHRTRKSDVYAFASTCLEIMIHERPYAGFNEYHIINHVVNKRLLPPLPSIEVKWPPADDLWAVMTRCWNYEPTMRPTIDQVRKELDAFHSNDPIEGLRRRV